MTILFIVHRFHTNQYYSAIALQRAGYNVKVLALYKGNSEYYKDIDLKILNLNFATKMTFKILKLFKKNYLKTQLELRLEAPDNELYNIIKQTKPEFILLKAYQDMLALKTLFIAKRLNIKVLMHTQTEFTHIKGSKFLFRMNIKLFSFLRVHAFVTPIFVNYQRFKDFGIDNVYYLPFVFPKNNNAICNEHKDKSLIKIMSIGKYVTRKDHLLLLKAVEFLINSRNYNLQLNIYGEKADAQYYKLIQNYISEHNLYEKVNLYENVDYPTICSKYMEHHLFVLPSHAEPAAFSIVEAMCNALPIICSDQNGTKSYIKEGFNGHIFVAKNLNSLIEKIEITISNMDFLSSNSLIAAERNHSLEHFTNQILNILNLKNENQISRK